MYKYKYVIMQTIQQISQLIRSYTLATSTPSAVYESCFLQQLLRLPLIELLPQGLTTGDIYCDRADSKHSHHLYINIIGLFR